MSHITSHRSSGRTSARRVVELREELSGRELALLSQVAELRFMTARQIERVHFSENERSAPTATTARAARRCLARLSEQRLLHRLERRIGGVRAGSAGYVYSLGPVGERVLELKRPRRREIEPSPTFLNHTLAISGLVVELIAASRDQRCDLVQLQTEPRCWRRQPGGGLLRPDLMTVIGADGYEYRWFIEVDLGTEHLPTLLRKCLAYQAYYRSGVEQHSSSGVFPRVLWLMHSQTRALRLRAAIDQASSLTPELFVVITIDRAVETATGGQP